MLNGKYLKRSGYGNSVVGDMEESFASEKQKQSKLEKIEMEYNRIIQRNNGQIFIVKNEKYRGIARSD